MSQKRRQYTAAYKFKVAMAAAKGDRTMGQLSGELGVHPSQIGAWKRHLVENGSSLFAGNDSGQGQRQASQEAALYEQIGRLQMELAPGGYPLKKKLPPSPEAKRAMIEREHPDLSVRRQCELVGLSRTTFYYQPARESALNLELMRLMDEQYLRTPFYGYRRMTAHLRRQGYPVNRKRVQRLMGTMGLQAIHPRPRTSQPGQGHKIYPYLLRNLAITAPNQVWSADITYVPLARGFMYLTAIIDWYSRYVLTIRTMLPNAPVGA